MKHDSERGRGEPGTNTAGEVLDLNVPAAGLNQKELGKNFLGAAEWMKGFNVNVGAVPPIPETITRKLLNTDCPIEPRKLIKETHILVLVPKTVNDKPYSALKLYELCSKSKGSGDKLIYDGPSWATAWKEKSYASSLQTASE